MIVSSEIQIADSELELTYARSSGPGGQNVNKVNSKAVLRWNLLSSASLSPSIHARVLARLANRLTVDGDLVIASDRYRDQIRNREDCLEKLRALLVSASAAPKPRKKTKPSRSSRQKTRETKSRNSHKKKLRKWRGSED